MTTPVHPYPGARPLQLEDEAILLGREADVRRIVNSVTSSYTKVVELTADSGVGKSSLLNAGLNPELRRSGRVVVHIDAWSDLAGDNDLDRYIFAVHSALERQDLLRPFCSRTDPLGYVAELSDVYGSNLVLVFDQLEELFRDSQELGSGFVREIGSLIANPRTRIPYTHVLSMRREFTDELRPLEEMLDRSQVEHIRLGEIADNDIADIVSEPLLLEDIPVEDAAVDEILRRYLLARDVDGRQVERSDRRVGLLHLQGLLWVLADQLAFDVDRGLGLEGLSAAECWPTEIATPHDAAKMFALALETYVDLKVGALATMAGGRGEEVADVVANMAQHLSSRGYKLVRDTDSLAPLALPGLAQLGLRDGEVAIAAAVARSILSTKETSDLEREIGVALRGSSYLLSDPADQRSLDVLRQELVAQDDAPAAMASGRMRYATAIDLLSACLSNFEGALGWLVETSIVRMTRTISGERVVALIHDGFGASLASWGARRLRSQDAPLRSLTALAGLTVFDDGTTISGTTQAPLVIRDARWLGCLVTADLRNVVFENCHFGGTRFQGCVLENVQFDGCALWGAIFAECNVSGDMGLLISGGREDAEIRTLTISGGSVLAPLADESGPRGGLRFEHLDGYGLFLDSVAGGPWVLDDCRLAHVSMDHDSDLNAGPLGPGWILRSTVRHLTTSTKHVGVVEIGAGSSVAFIEAGSGARELDDALGDLSENQRSPVVAGEPQSG
uniref:Novel STAND NTPase 1 domain-containing protein n=1 Tax=uncultured bacterium A1Q1_fos_1000 TaxID=1256536 RepID=L7VWJ9_9BACT|nr:hypothetical protein [uncultured bacterium A1Q1_fos_1000]